MSTLFESGCIFKDTDGDSSHDKDDLMLAAELGKSLLERNRELDAALRATQEYADEQCAQADFYLNQVEILREENETSYQTCEQLESNNQILSDKCEQWKAEFKILESKNSRLWEVINSLEKRIEEHTSELDVLREDIVGIEDERINDNEEDCNVRQQPHVNAHLDNSQLDEKDSPVTSTYELEKEIFKKQISELNIQIKLIKLQKGEIECQLEDVVVENQLLYNKISALNQEITEWENFAQKEENYRRLAAAFTLKHFIEADSDVGNIFERSLQETHFTKNTMTRSRSCECLNYNDKKVDFLKSPNLVNNILSSVNSSSFLSELDTEYSELVQRYEALLEKYKQEGKLNENPERTRKVQKAIQTLSLDFSNIPTLSSPSISPQKEKTFYDNTGETSPVRRLPSLSCCTQTITPSISYNKESLFDKTGTCNDATSPVWIPSVSCSSQNAPDSPVDYQAMFSQIFAKLKESKEIYM